MIDKFLRKPEIDEPGTGDLRRWPNVVHRYIRDDQSREISGVLLQFLAQHHRRICLVITMARIGRRCYLQRFINRNADLLKGILQALLQQFGDGHSSGVQELQNGISGTAEAEAHLLQLLNSGIWNSGSWGTRCLVVENSQDFFGRLRLRQLFADRFVVQEFGNRGQRAEMNLKLIFRHHK